MGIHLKTIIKVVVVVMVLNYGFVFGQTYSTMSPNKHIILSVFNQKGKVYYGVNLNGKAVIYPSLLGFEGVKSFGSTPTDKLDLTGGMEFIDGKVGEINETWQPVLGEMKNIKNHCNELLVRMKTRGDKGYYMNVRFRVFDDGIGFRYEFPEQEQLNYFIITKENTEFSLQKDYTAWWMAGSYNTNEYSYNETLLSKIDANRECGDNKLFLPLGCDDGLVQTPLMLKSPQGVYMNIHEAALVHFPAMQIKLNKKDFTFSADLVPDAFNNKAYLKAPFSSPWRVVIMSEKATDIIASKIILNLNEPNKLSDYSWIKPVKYIGVWWEMFVGKGTWDYAGTQNSAQDAKPTGKHSANTGNVKKYIDFASKHGFNGILVEGWNTGWEDWFGKWKEDVFDFVTPYPDFNVKELQAYAKSKGVYLIMHHETSGSAMNYERWMDSAYKFMNEYGYPAVKTGYVGPIIPRGEHHDGQWMVDHYIRVAEKAAKYKIMIDVHEPVRPTGVQRTYPNWMACEAAKGMEYNAWGAGNKIDHDLNLIFTRFIGGPMDYTPGILKLKLDYFPGKKEIIHSTVCRQLALYVVMYSPLQMAADLPENYEAKLDAFQFIKDVPTDWDDTKILEAEPGEYITTARKGKHTNDWFVGSITDEKDRDVVVNLDFLDEDKAYVATIYKDGTDTKVDVNPETYVIEKKVVKRNDKIHVRVVGAGGCAISIKEQK